MADSTEMASDGNQDEFSNPFWEDDFRFDPTEHQGIKSVIQVSLSNKQIKASPEKFEKDSKESAPKFIALLAKI